MSNRPNSGSMVDMTVEGWLTSERAEANLLRDLGVVAQLARAIDVGVKQIADLLVDPFHPFRTEQVLRPARWIGGIEADLDLVLSQPCSNSAADPRCARASFSLPETVRLR